MSTFKQELEDLINRTSQENGSNTPDFILAEYLSDCLTAFDKAVNRRTEWYEPPKQKLTEEPVDLRPMPTTLEEAIDYVLPKFIGMEPYVEEHDEDGFASFCHSQLSGGIGMHIRNGFKLWQQESPLHQYFLTHHNLFHADDMSDLIIRGVYKKMKANAKD